MSDTPDAPHNWQYRLSTGEEPPVSITDSEVLAMIDKAALIRLAETRAQMVHQLRGLSAADANGILFWKSMATSFAAEVKRAREVLHIALADHAKEVSALNKALLEARAATAPRKEREARRGK